MSTKKETCLIIGILVVMCGLFCLWQMRKPRQNRDKELTQHNSLPEKSKEASVAVKPLDEGDITSRSLEQPPRQLEKDEKIPVGVKQALQRGAKAKVTFRVVDSTGKPVEGATVFGGFYNHGKRGYGFKALTDINGLLVQENMCMLDVNYSVEKEGHYRSTGRHWFFTDQTDCVRDGHWIPWNKTLEVVLKEKRNPIPMYVRSKNIQLPQKKIKYGFDFQKAELVKPHGSGEHADIFLMCSGEQQGKNSLNFTKNLTIASSNPHDGFIREKKDSFSMLCSEHVAPEDGYLQEIKLSIRRTSEEILEQIEISNDDYVVFRTRTKEENGQRIQANYGKIYGEIWYGISSNECAGARVSLLYYFNPTPNDRNLEFDGKNNLFKPHWNDTMNNITQP